MRKRFNTRNAVALLRFFNQGCFFCLRNVKFRTHPKGCFSSKSSISKTNLPCWHAFRSIEFPQIGITEESSRRIWMKRLAFLRIVYFSKSCRISRALTSCFTEIRSSFWSASMFLGGTAVFTLECFDCFVITVFMVHASNFEGIRACSPMALTLLFNFIEYLKSNLPC
jgi:hypothetical protein